MIEIAENETLFQDLDTGIKYHEITKEMIEGCVDDQIDNAYEPWAPIGKNASIVEPASKCFKMFRPELYTQWIMEYIEANNIEVVENGEVTRYFEYDEDANEKK